MITERRQFTAAEVEEINKAGEQLRGLDDSPEANEHHANLIDAYFQTNRSIPITVANIFKFVESRKQDFKWLSPAQLEYRKIESENPAAAAQFATWFANQKLLVNTGDEGFRNASSILQELRGRAVTQETIQNAIASIGAPVSRFHTARRPLHFVQTPRRTEPVSRAAKEDDGERFLGSDFVKQADGTLRSKTVQEQRREREAAERANSQSQPTTQLSETDQAWKRMAGELLRDGTHSQQERVRVVYDREQGNGWRRVYEACKREVEAYKNRGIR